MQPQTIQKEKTTQWEKIFANIVTNKGLLISEIFKQLIKLNTKKKPTKLKKNGQKTSIDISPKKISNQQAHEKMLNVSNY